MGKKNSKKSLDEPTPKILLLDIETSLMLVWVFNIWEQTIQPNQIKDDWFILAWAAKWLDDPKSKIMYRDLRGKVKRQKDKSILIPLWKLLCKADIIVTQNGKKFDERKFNARFIQNKMDPPSSYRHIDTYKISSNKFGFTSKGLKYVQEKIGSSFANRKTSHDRFPGMELWIQCQMDNPKAWKAMEKYNKQDVFALEEVFKKMRPWCRSFNPVVYGETSKLACECGSGRFHRNGFHYGPNAKYRRYRCSECGCEVRDKKNLVKTKTT